MDPATATSSSASSPHVRPTDGGTKVDGRVDLESGYASASSSTGSLPQISLTKAHVKHLNEQLEHMEPQDILRFARVFFPNLYQTTAFGLTGLVTIDMLAKLQAEDAAAAAVSSSPPPPRVDLVFLDTLHHFGETYDLVERVRSRYPSVHLHVYRPADCATAAEFDARHGARLWEADAELYDWVAKVEPQQRAYAELGVAAVLTGRRRSQGGERSKVGVVEWDEERGIAKINPLVRWSFEQVRAYVAAHDVPYNELLDRGYKSVGDWHSTSPVADGEDERAGRWKGQAKTECGIHNKKSRYALFLEEVDRKAREKELADALGNVHQERRAHDEDEQQQTAAPALVGAVEIGASA